MPGWPKELAPGQTGSFEVELSTAGKSGSQSKTVSVTTNDPATANFIYTLKGNIFQPIEITPQAISIRTTPNQVVTKTATIKNNTDKPLNLSDITYPDEKTAEMMTVNLSTKHIPPQGSAEVSVVFNAKAPGREFKSFTIGTDNPSFQSLNLRVSAVVDDPNQQPPAPEVPAPQTPTSPLTPNKLPAGPDKK